MADKKRLSAEQQKKLMAEEMWLHYFNQTLFNKGVITEAEHNRIVNMIASRGMSGKMWHRENTKFDGRNG